MENTAETAQLDAHVIVVVVVSVWRVCGCLGDCYLYVS